MAANKTQSHVLHPELSYDINGMLFAVHNELGPYAREKQYSDGFENKLKARKLRFQRELRIGNSGNIIDVLVEGKIAIELKAKRALTSEDYRQIQNYLQAGSVELGLLVNFRHTSLKPIRVLRLTRPAQNKQNGL
jgi:GxxExxY protein